MSPATVLFDKTSVTFPSVFFSDEVSWRTSPPSLFFFSIRTVRISIPNAFSFDNNVLFSTTLFYFKSYLQTIHTDIQARPETPESIDISLAHANLARIDTGK